jgi:hypothetical protein
MHTTEPLVPEPSPFEVEIAIAELKSSDQITAELIQAKGEILRSEIHKLINSTRIWSKEELPNQWRSLLLYQFTRRKIQRAVVSIVEYPS